MKKIIVLSIMVYMIMSCCGCCLEYGKKSLEEGDFRYEMSSIRKECFVFYNGWDGDEDNMTINIADEVNGYKVVTLGGYIGTGYPMEFHIDIPDIQAATDCWCSDLPEDAEVITYHFTVNLGKNIRKIYSWGLDEYCRVADTNQYRQVLLTVNCTEENKYFYSIDGKLYNKSDDTLVEGISYYSE